MIDTNQNIIDVRNLIERFEELEDEKQSIKSDIEDADDAASTIAAYSDLAQWMTENLEEFKQLESVLEELQGNGGDEQWRGNWYPVTLIRESYFKDYAQELADDIGAIPDGATWPNNCIDWNQAARELSMDYTDIDIGDVSYSYR